MESRDSHSLSRGVACKNVKFFKNVARPVMRMIFKLHYRMVACTTACFANGMHIDYAQIRVLDGLFQSVAFESARHRGKQEKGGEEQNRGGGGMLEGGVTNRANGSRNRV
jgi:hypothetical protein